MSALTSVTIELRDTEAERMAVSVPCPNCGAERHDPCKHRDGTNIYGAHHYERLRSAALAAVRRYLGGGK